MTEARPRASSIAPFPALSRATVPLCHSIGAHIPPPSPPNCPLPARRSADHGRMQRRSATTRTHGLFLSSALRNLDRDPPTLSVFGAARKTHDGVVLKRRKSSSPPPSPQAPFPPFFFAAYHPGELLILLCLVIAFFLSLHLPLSERSSNVSAVAIRNAAHRTSYIDWRLICYTLSLLVSPCASRREHIDPVKDAIRLDKYVLLARSVLCAPESSSRSPMNSG